MKQLFTILAMAISVCASAQNLPAIEVGLLPSGEYVERPNSTIFVDLEVTTSEFTAGVYARFAQRLLGERAQLMDKTSVTIQGADLTIAPKDYFIQSQREPSTQEVQTIVQTIPMDRSSSALMTPEQMAQDAANQIFANRRICQELISGDIGEGVYGEGLNSALQRFDQIEREYLALFMGKQNVEKKAHRYVINLNSEMQRYMICRYDAQKGILSPNDLNGEAVYLQITPAEVTDSTIANTSSKSAPGRQFIVPNRAQCDVYVGANIVSSTTLPLYDFGQTITVIKK